MDDVGHRSVVHGPRRAGPAGGREARIELAPVLTSAAEARRWVGTRLAGVPSELRPTIALLVSELVANAVVHAGAPVTLWLRTTGRHVHVEVSDGSRQVPAARAHDPEADSGRGLTVVARLADEWGTRVDDKGKVVWFTLAFDPVDTREEAP